MHSIKSKFIALNLIGILICSGLIWGISTFALSDALDRSSNEILSLTCQSSATMLDTQLGSVQNSVRIVAKAATEGFDRVQDLKNSAFLEAYLAEIDRLLDNVGRNTNGVCSYYLHLAPEVTASNAGLLYLAGPNGGNFRQVPLTDLSLYGSDDLEHVGWYYIPKRAGAPTWLEPYYNKNLDLHMISYVIPLYKNGRFLGVVGMDVDFELIVQAVSAIQPYETAHSFLMSQKGDFYYHPDFTSQETPQELGSDFLALTEGFRQKSGHGYVYSYEGRQRKAAFTALINDMELVLSVETGEINSKRNQLTWVVILATLIVASAFEMVAVYFSERITQPLKQLTEAALRISQGNENDRVSFPVNATDEVGILARTLADTTAALRERMAGISHLAFVDPLTGAKSRAEFTIAMERLNTRMAQGDRSFTVLVADLNHLKKVNDRYGHTKGDEYIRGGYSLLEKTFLHSPIYRIGGDEFFILLQGEDVENLDALLEKLRGLMDECARNRNPWERFSVAVGAASCREEDLDAEAVFRRADIAMYDNKLAMKAGRT